MQYDEIVDCPKSGGDLCYKIEISKDITNYFSLSCGYWTNSLMVPGNTFYEEQMMVLPELHKDIAWTDPKTDLVWIPNTINNIELGMVFADGTNKDEWSWASVKAVKLGGEEGEETGEAYKMDMSTKKNFHERDYMDALSYIGVLPE
jgi:hypothetical protein|tara:strand:+ start:41 stop:481 length:441 start_codon:yes stop_codon:yes gene_type:complete